MPSGQYAGARLDLRGQAAKRQGSSLPHDRQRRRAQGPGGRFQVDAGTQVRRRLPARQQHGLLPALFLYRLLALAGPRASTTPITGTLPLPPQEGLFDVLVGPLSRRRKLVLLRPARPAGRHGDVSRRTFRSLGGPLLRNIARSTAAICRATSRSTATAACSSSTAISSVLPTRRASKLNDERLRYDYTRRCTGYSSSHRFTDRCGRMLSYAALCGAVLLAAAARGTPGHCRRAWQRDRPGPGQDGEDLRRGRFPRHGGLSERILDFGRGPHPHRLELRAWTPITSPSP